MEIYRPAAAFASPRRSMHWPRRSLFKPASAFAADRKTGGAMTQIRPKHFAALPDADRNARDRGMIREIFSAFEQEHVAVPWRATPIEPRFTNIVLSECAKSIRLNVSLRRAENGRAAPVA